MAIPPTHLIFGFTLSFVAYIIVKSIYTRIQRYQRAKAQGCEAPRKIPSGFLGLGTYRRYKQVGKDHRAWNLYYQFFLEGGNTFEQNILGTTQIITVEPENVKAVLATQFNDFALGARRQIFYPLLGDGIFTLDGAGWSHSRAMLRPQFSREQVADVAMLGDHVDQLISLIPSDGTPFDIQEYFNRLTLDTATEFLFGESTGSLETGSKTTTGPLATVGGEEGFAYAFNRSQEYMVERVRAQDLYWLVNSAESRKLNKIVHNVVDYYVDQALKRRNNAGEEEKRIDSTSTRYVFLDVMARESQDRKGLRDQMLNILLAGRDTTASLLSSTFFYLSRNPHVWKRLREEILNVFPPTESADKITIARLRDVRYLKHVLNEVLRLLPPVPSNTRWATKDTTLPVGGGPDGKSPVFVPKGKKVTYVVTNMHRRKDIWGQDALEFRPERWEENGKRGWEFLPFNGGPRICLGRKCFLLLLPLFHFWISNCRLMMY